MSILSSIAKPQDRPILCTITGDAGLGKTSLAATFPSPIFIRAEDGLQAVPKALRPDAFPVITTIDNLWEQLTSLIKEDHQYKTLVIDSITQLDTLFMNWIVDTDPKKPRTIAQALGGYGAGFQALSSLHGRVRKAAGILNEVKGMNIVFVAHADTETIELPDQDPYTRYNIRMQKKSVSHYVDNVDLCGFLKLETFTQGDGERKKAISDGTRLLVTYATAANISKNRYGITEDLIVTAGQNPLINLIPSIGA
jgi:AAA domain